tara:strand:+ start:29 stop:388 length:360 start_codon:yes stop_codon:yes gene_type:complete
MDFEKLSKMTEAAERGLCKTLGDTIDRELIEDDIERGRAELWEIDGGEAYMITELTPKELVVHCIQGRGVKEIAAHVAIHAKAQGLHSVRFHTDRTSLARLLADYKPRHIEHVYRIDLT